MNGKGILTVPGGKKSEGEWEQGKKNGEGTYSIKGRIQYQGEWKDENIMVEGLLYVQMAVDTKG